MTTPLLMEESEFHKRVDAILGIVEAAMDDTESDIDAEFNGGILTLTFENGSKIIVNRQTPNREIWVAAKSGGFHFRHDMRYEKNAGEDNEKANLPQQELTSWHNTRSGESLADLLTRVVSEQAGEVINFTL
jgi:CyaY protein